MFLTLHVHYSAHILANGLNNKCLRLWRQSSPYSYCRQRPTAVNGPALNIRQFGPNSSFQTRDGKVVWV
jgi:hypothetical protein